jgi:pimeloyl-ACP methyl ester carboxylesterase
VAYEATGSGSPILKSANWMSHIELDRRSPLTRHWLAMLSDGRTLYRFDGRGYGMSDRRPPELSFEAMVTDLETVADAAGLERFPIVGFCHGGPLAIAYAARHPERDKPGRAAIRTATRVPHLVYASGRQHAFRFGGTVVRRGGPPLRQPDDPRPARPHGA